MDIWSSTAGEILMTMLLAMLPVLELRGAIPIGVAHGLNIWVAIGVSIIGNLIPVPFYYHFLFEKFSTGCAASAASWTGW